jgi:hypothetical protein
MAFVIENKTKHPRPRPEGHYMRLEDGSEWQIHDITISASGKICMKLWNPQSKEHQIKTPCTIEDLVAQFPGSSYIEY